MTPDELVGCPDPALLVAVDEHVLDPPLEAQVRRHLATCTTCRQTAEALRETFDREPALDVRARIAQRVAEQPPRRASAWRWAGPMAALATAAAVLLIVAVPDPVAPDAPVRFDSSSPLRGGATVFHPDLPIFVAGEGALAMRSRQSAREAMLARIGAALDEAAAGRFDAALEQLDRLAREEPASADVPLAVGATHLLAGRASEAIAALERGRSLADGSLGDEYDWHLAVAHVKAGAPDRARARLVPVCEHGGPRAAVACAGLAEISRRPGPSRQ